jgi:hypothetical protein
VSDRHSQMRRVLLVAYYFPPIAATGAMRPLNFCRHLASYGWASQVVATDHGSALPSHAVDRKLLDRVPSDVEVIRVPHPNPIGRLVRYRERLSQLLTQGKVSNSAMGTGSAARSQASAKGSTSLVRSSLRLLSDALLEFPDPQCHWYRPAVRALANMPVQGRPHIIWATGGPWTSLLVGKRLAQEFNIPFVADFRDPWVGGYEFFASKSLHEKAKNLERGVCAVAARVILNTEELRLRFCSVYPEWQHKFVTITNGYAEENPSVSHSQGTRGTVAKMEGGDSPTLELCHFGTVYGNRSPIALFRAIQELLDEGMVQASRLKIRFVGAWDVNDSDCTQLAKALVERGVLRLVPPVPHQECLQEMARADVLLILQPDYPLQVPAKIYEYIVAGRPMLVIGGEGATANLVQRHRLGLCCPNTVQDVKRTLMSILSSESVLCAPTPADTEQFSYRALSGRLAELLDHVCEEQQGSRNRK